MAYQAQRLPQTILVALSLIFITTCGLSACSREAANAPTNIPPWQLVWHSPQGTAPQGQSVQEAFAQGAILMHNADASPLPATATTWLATSTTFGFALVQLDPSAQYQDVVMMSQDSNHTWVANATALKNGEPCTNGQTKPTDVVTFPEPVCGNGGLAKVATANTPWRYTVDSWYSTSHIYVLGHFGGVIITPDKAASATTIQGKPSWAMQENGITVITVALANNDFVVFASTADSTTAQSLAAESLAHVSTLAPLP